MESLRTRTQRHAQVREEAGYMNVALQVVPSPSRRGSVLIPGLPLLPSNVERHVVPGSGSRTLSLDAGDEVTVVDSEGRQPCELVVFDTSGRSDPALIGASATGRPQGIQAILQSREPSAKRVTDALAAHGFDLGHAAAVHCFGDESRAGESVSFVATAPVTLVAGAPGGPMPVDAQSRTERHRALRPARDAIEPEVRRRPSSTACRAVGGLQHPARRGVRL